MGHRPVGDTLTMQARVLPFKTPGGAPPAPAKSPPEPYPFAPVFERALVTALCQRPALYGKVARYLDVESLTSAEARLAVQAAKAFAKDLGRGPEKLATVLQRVSRWVGEGKHTHDEAAALDDWFGDAQDAGLPPDEELLAELAPVVLRRVEKSGLEEAFEAFKQGGDLTTALMKIQQAMRLQDTEQTPGMMLGGASFEELERLKRSERLPTGLLELDDVLKGGPRRGTGNMFLGPASGGKSMALIQVANGAAMVGAHVAYATLELPVEDIMARLKANLTSIPVDAILDEPLACGAKEALESMMLRTTFGSIVVAAFTPKLTTPRDLFEWVKLQEADRGITIDVLVVDYADKLGTSSRAPTKDTSSYAEQGTVYDELFIWARDQKRWLWTASQSGRNKDKGKTKLMLDDVADSMGKIRNFDTVITINPRDNYTQVVLGIEKNRRDGNRGREVGPLPVEFSLAQIAPVVWP